MGETHADDGTPYTLGRMEGQLSAMSQTLSQVHGFLADLKGDLQRHTQHVQSDLKDQQSQFQGNLQAQRLELKEELDKIRGNQQLLFRMMWMLAGGGAVLWLFANRIVEKFLKP